MLHLFCVLTKHQAAAGRTQLNVLQYYYIDVDLTSFFTRTWLTIRYVRVFVIANPSCIVC